MNPPISFVLCPLIEFNALTVALAGLFRGQPIDAGRA